MLDRDSNNIWKRVFSSLWDTRRIKFSQSHSLKRLSCSVASGRPNCFTKCWTSTTINVSYRISFVCKIKGRSFLSTTLKCIHWVLLNRGGKKKKTRIQPAENSHHKTLKKHYNNNKYRHFKLKFESLQKHKQDSLNIKPKTRNRLTLTKAQKCNHFVY